MVVASQGGAALRALIHKGWLRPQMALLIVVLHLLPGAQWVQCLHAQTINTCCCPEPVREPPPDTIDSPCCASASVDVVVPASVFEAPISQVALWASPEPLQTPAVLPVHAFVGRARPQMPPLILLKSSFLI